MDEEKDLSLEKLPEEPVLEVVEENIEEQEKDSTEEVEKTPKKSNKIFYTCLIFVLIAFVVALLVSAFKKETPDSILNEATNNFYNAKNIALASTHKFEFNDPELSGAENAELTFSLSSLSLPTDVNFGINIVTVDGDEILANLKAKVTKDRKVYINTSNLENFLDDMNFSPILSIMLGEDFYYKLVSEVDEEWWEIDNDVINFISDVSDAENTEKAKEMVACLNEKTKNFSVKNLKFLSATPVKNKLRTFELHIDSDELANLTYEPANCLSEVSKEILSERLAATIGELPNIFIDVDDTNHFSRIYFYDENSTYSSESIIKLTYNEDFVFETPESYAPFSELLELYKSTNPELDAVLN